MDEMKISDCDESERKKQLVEKLHSLIRELWAFLEAHIPLANTHGAEFISSSHWEEFVPPTAQEELLSLSNEDLVKLPLCKANTCDESIACDGSETKRVNSVSCHTPTRAEGTGRDWLQDFLQNAYKLRLQNMDVLKVQPEGNKIEVISEAMSEKKSHEVELLSKTVKQMCDSCSVDTVVDLGSGKGYLSTELSRQHFLPVLGLDSSEVNTQGAMTRDARLGKRWQGLERKNRKKKMNNVKEGENELSSQDRDDPFPSISAEIDKLTVAEKHSSISNAEQHHSTQLKNFNKDLHNSEKELKVRTEDMGVVVLNIEQTPETSKPSSDQPLSTALQCTPPSDVQLYVPLTLFVHPALDLRHVLRHEAPQLCRGKDAKAMRLLVTGLHTCGSLAVTGMRLFLQDPAVVGLCLVGCCYQLMEEAPSGKEDNENQYGFPLSQFGKDIGLCLGRNARNLASQSVHRIQASKQLQGSDFYWRALLDVLLRDLGHPVPERIVGMRGLNKRSKCFYDYAVGALKKLGLEMHKEGQKTILALEMKYSSFQHKMACFFQLKLALAPVIESLILLDRYLFLLEQENVASASLVQMFDPRTSPRCFALIATKIH